MKYLKRINWYSWLTLSVLLLKILFDCMININYIFPFNYVNIFVITIVGIYCVASIVNDLYKNKNLKIIYGIVSGDYETETVDVTHDSFIEFTGNKPKDFDKSVFYKELYMLYRIPVSQHMRNLKYDNKLLKIKLNDYGIVSVRKTNIDAIRK